ncbi:MAG: sugar phosphate isomerase/epimerase family protein, partial [Armatimonadota bacterium]|nr:sugar phosphate isomerase/epimerase family protein [Armatimonadota bacterium]
EPRIEAKHRHGIELDATPAQRAEARRIAAESGISLCCVATSRVYANPETNKENIELTRRCIDLAADVGSPRIRVFGGQFPAQLDRASAISLVADSLAQVAEYAADRGVTLCVETHDAWCDPLHLAEVMKRVNHPNVAINWDIMHPIFRGNKSMEEAFEIVKPWVRHCHIHDGVMRDGKLELVWIGTGAIDHKKAMECLKGLNYQPYLSGEWINRQPPYTEHLPKELETLKRYEKELAG